ncbi:hypothetical protein PN445_10365 [Dolichospermum circinale CS-537/11]|nr:HipA family kinase [Dolichospermum circinale]MDB9475016.1 hypothetical protein [Dolichospermum circinale CS-537/11]
MENFIIIDAIFCGPPKLPGETPKVACGCGDAGQYIVKLNSPGRYTCHSEWLSSSIAEIVGVPQVPFSIVRHVDETLCFGSRWVLNILREWWILAQTQRIDIAHLSENFSRIFALDLFFQNEDRHADNFMITNVSGKIDVQAFDWEHGWLYRGFPPRPIAELNVSSTMQVRNWLLANTTLTSSIDAINQTLDRLHAISALDVARILDASPEEWLPLDMRTSILDWWGGVDFRNRIEEIKDGAANGLLI